MGEEKTGGPGARIENSHAEGGSQAEVDYDLVMASQVAGDVVGVEVVSTSPGEQSESKRVVIMGGGSAGCLAALRFAKAGHQVTLLERRSELLSGSSNNNPCRAGIGLHYLDKDTAKEYLTQVIKLNREYPGYLLKGKQGEEYLQQGDYYLAADSKITQDEFLNLCEKQKQVYQDLIEDDPANAIYGSAEDFYRLLREEEWSGVNKDKVTLGVRTVEHLFNWPRLRQKIINDVNASPNITVVSDAHVTDAALANDSSFSIFCDDGSEYQADFVVNATWENVDRLNRKVGFFDPTLGDSETYKNRPKVMISIELPDSLKDTHSIFIGFGAYASLSNAGNGIGYLTYEPVTNINEYEGHVLSESEIDALLYGSLSEDNMKEYQAKIIEGAAQYIPELKNAVPLEIKCGVVRHKGSVNIYAVDELAKRNYCEVDSYHPRWIKCCATKFAYCQLAGDEAFAMFSNLLVVEAQIDRVLQIVNKNQRSSMHQVSLRALREHLGRSYFDRNLIKSDDEVDKFARDVQNTVRHRTEVLADIPDAARLSVAG